MPNWSNCKECPKSLCSEVNFDIHTGYIIYKGVNFRIMPPCFNRNIYKGFYFFADGCISHKEFPRPKSWKNFKYIYNALMRWRHLNLEDYLKLLKLKEEINGAPKKRAA